MTTVKLKLDNEIDVLKEQRSFNNVVRLSFNRFQDGFKEKEIRAYLRDKFDSLNCWFVQCGIKVGQQLFHKHKQTKIIFGGKYNLKRYLKKQISKDEFKENRMLPINIQGQQLHKGNRLFNFDFENNQLEFKLSRTNHRTLKYKVPHKKIRNNLARLQELIDNKQISVTVSLTKSDIYLTFDESKITDCNFKDLKRNRVLGIDMNPNYIGVSILEFDEKDNFKILDKRVFDLSRLTAKSGKSSADRKSKYLTNKLNHETIQIAHDICNLVDYWKCDKVVIEDLSIRSSDKGSGKYFNRLCNNVWKRNLFVNKLKNLSLLCNFSLVEVNPCYTSFIGNVIYGDETTPDMVAASIEIARRGYKKFEKSWFYPSVRDKKINEQWKQTLSRFDDWKSAFQEIKKSKVKYRFLLQDYVQNAVFSKFYSQKQLLKYSFI